MSINSKQDAIQVTDIINEISMTQAQDSIPVFCETITDLFNQRYQHLTGLTILIANQTFGKPWEDTVAALLNAGFSIQEVEETILHLSIYVGLPKALQCFQELKKLGFTHQKAENLRTLESRIQRFIPSQFNFFLQPDIQNALHEIHPDFGWLAGYTASTLCARGGLTPLERAHITIISDVCQNVFNGPFQIHTRMVIECGGSREFLMEELRHLRYITHAYSYFSIPHQNLLKAEDLLGPALEVLKK